MRKPDDVDDPQQVDDIVHLDERRHAELGREDLEVDDVALGQRLCDQEDRVRARRARFPHLVEVDDEVLAQDGQLHRVAHRMDVLELAAEVVLVGETRDRARAVRGVGLRDRDRIEVLADHPRRRALALDLRDDVRRVRVPAVDHRLEEVPRPAELGDPLLQDLDGHSLARALDFVELPSDDVLQN